MAQRRVTRWKAPDIAQRSTAPVGRAHLLGWLTVLLTWPMLMCSNGDAVPAPNPDAPRFEADVDLNIPVDMGAPMVSLPSDTAIDRFVDETAFTSDSKGDVFLILIDTLRRDYLAQYAVHISQFMNENFSVHATANATATQHATFAAFHSLPSQLTMKDINGPPGGEPQGALPLRIFDKLGYDIYAFGYYLECLEGAVEPGSWEWTQQDYFGFESALLKNCKDLPPGANRRTIDVVDEDDSFTDDDVVAAFEKHVTAPGPNFHLVYFYSTHLDYTWDKNMPNQIPSSARGVDVPDLFEFDQEEIRDAYKNAVMAVDGAFKQTLDAITRAGRYDAATIILMADHGESLGEKPPSVTSKDKERFVKDGKLYFHGNSMYQKALDVPIAIKFPKNRAPQAGDSAPPDSMYTMDVFPSVLSGMNVQPMPRRFMYGRSVLLGNGSASARSTVSVMPNRLAPTRKMVLVNGRYKVFIQVTEEDFYNSSTFNIMNITDLDDRSIYQTEEFAPFGITPEGTREPAALAEKIKADFAEALAAMYKTEAAPAP